MQSLRLFCDVAACRSFSAAAGRHGITQSAASQRVGQLEKRLGVMLLDRSVRPLELTAAGEVFFRECQELIERYEQLESRISKLRPRPTGVVRVAAIYSAGIDLLHTVQEKFEAQTPEASVVIQYRRPEAVVDAVRNGQCDLGLVSYPDHWSGVASIPLRNERMAVVCSPEHPWAGRGRVQAGELDQWPMAAFEPTLPAARHIRRYLRDQGVTPRIANVFDNVDTIKSAVAVSSDQIAILPKRTAWREARSGTLAVLSLEPALLRPLGIIYWRRRGRAHGGLSPVAQAFVDCLLALAGPNIDLTDEIDQSRPSQLVGERL